MKGGAIYDNFFDMEDRMITKKERREMKRAERRETLNNMEKVSTYKRIAVWSGAFLALALGIAGFVNLAVNSGGSEQVAAVVMSVNENDWSRGPADAKVTIVEYSDFQCPACASYHPIVKTIVDEFPKDVRLVYRHFPLSQHAQARLTAYAAEAAGRQGKFWEMHDMLFDTQSLWAESDKAEEIVNSLAEKLNLNMDKFNSDVKDSGIIKKVDKDYASGVSAGVNSTPTFYVNGRKIKNPRGLEEFRKVVTDSLSDNK